MSSRSPGRAPGVAGLAVLWGGAIVLVWVVAGRFWIPLDDGTLAQSAERVLTGELPHRDFGDPYTGLNAVVGALAFRVFGVSLPALRVPLVAGFALWLPALWLLARRILRPGAALAATLLAAVLSVPAYPAAMPTWFALFAVTWGTWLLLTGIEGERRARLAGAGALAGVAILFKVVGLYFLAAALLSLAWHHRRHGSVYIATVVGGVILFCLALSRLVLPASGATGVYFFLLPTLALSAALVARHLLPDPASRTGSVARERPRLWGDAAALCAASTLPLAAFLVPYALTGAVTSWLEGVFLLPGRRFVAAASGPGALWTAVPGLVAVALAFAAARLEPRTERRLFVVLAAGLAFLLAVDDALGGAPVAWLWYSARGWVSALVLLVALWALAHPRREALPLPAFLLAAVAALWTLVQFPYAAPAYFFYVAPLGVLATAGAVGAGILRVGPVLALLAGVYLFLGAGYAAGVAASSEAVLPGPRGGLLVPASDATLYGDLLREITLQGGPSPTLWAGPDAPEVYFLTGAPNPTPTLYEFLDPEPRSAGDLGALVDSVGIGVAVVNTRPLFSRPLDPATLEMLMARFPAHRSVGPFLVLGPGDGP